MQGYPVRLLRSMLETYSPSGSEGTIAGMLNDELSSLGFESHIDATGNVVAEAGHTGPEIVLCGHMDTVPGQIPVRLDGDFLYGRGAVDAKSSLAAMIVAASELVKETAEKMQVKLVGVVQEETSGDGFRHFLSTRIPSMIVFGEPSHLTNMIIGYKGRINLQVECTTSGGHSASPWFSKNSIEEAYGFWTNLQSELLDNGSESKFNTITGSLTGINTSGPDNSIPASAQFTVDIRLPPGSDPGHIIARIQGLAESYCSARPGVGLAVSSKEQTRGYVADPDSSLVHIYRKAIRSVTGTSPALLKKTGSSDMNLLTSGVPAIAYGPGDSTLDHSESEKVSVSEYLESIQVHTQALRLFARTARLNRETIMVSS